MYLRPVTKQHYDERHYEICVVVLATLSRKEQHYDEPLKGGSSWCH